jgi:pantothenate kinase
MKLIVAGGRSFKNYDLLCEKVDLITVKQKIE